MITITDTAKAKLAETLVQYPEYKYIRLGVRGGGCSGFEYSIGLVNEKEDDWTVIECPGVTVVVDPMSLMYITDVTVDYMESLMGSGFHFSNPSTRSECGCGKSFST